MRESPKTNNNNNKILLLLLLVLGLSPLLYIKILLLLILGLSPLLYIKILLLLILGLSRIIEDTVQCDPVESGPHSTIRVRILLGHTVKKEKF